MKKAAGILAVALMFMLFAQVSASEKVLPETRERVRIVEGEAETVTETLYHSPWDFSFWYDEETFLIEKTEAEYGSGVSISPVVTDFPVYLEIYPPETAGVLPWKFLELNAREGDEYNYDTLESGARIIWFERTEAGFVQGYYAVESEKSFVVAFLECDEEIMEGYGEHLKEVLWSVSFDDELSSSPDGETLDDKASKTVPVKIRRVNGEKADISLDHSSEWTLPGETLPLIEFSADSTVKNFQILRLAFEDVDADGNLKFKEEMAYEQDLLEPGKPILAEMNFIGTIPNYGISFMDENDVIRRYLVEESGKDGSLFLGEW